MGVMSLFDNAARNTKAGIKKAKLKANNAVLERRINSRKKVFGIEAYDTISCFMIAVNPKQVVLNRLKVKL